MNEAPAQAPGGPFEGLPGGQDLPNETVAYEEEEEDENDDEFVYSQLDTIEEEDENDEEEAAAWARRGLAEKSSRSQKVAGDNNQRANQHQAVKQENKTGATTTTTTTVRPQAANCATASSPQASQPNGNNGGDISANNKCDTIRQHQETFASKRMQQQQQQQQLPSTNRLISEHQARQQQTLFKALAERQKLMDELAADDDELRRRFDLMSSSASTVASLARTSKSRRHARQQQQHQHQQRTAVPLSAVDLTSMSDGMLDELLGHIASASSSSLSSQCGESLDSSDLSCPSAASSSTGATSDSSDSSEASENHTRRRRRRQRRRRRRREEVAELGRDFASPNVVGVHEEPVVGGAAADGLRRSGSGCRDAHRRGGDNHQGGDGDDDDHKRRLGIKAIGGDSRHQQEASLSPKDEAPRDLAEPTNRKPTKLEQYFTSGLVEPHRFSEEEEEEAEDEPPDADGDEAESVEEVLARMLAALQEIGADEQERLNELLERGFGHLEQLLQCSLAPTVATDGSQQQQASQGQAKLGQQQLSSSSSPSTLLLSKDSDYGSDTQSADCLSAGQSALVNAGANQSGGRQDSSSSPAPSSLNTNSSGGQQQKATTGKRPELSPLAIELSFKLAESLHRLAQQQQQQQQQQQATRLESETAPTETSTATTTPRQQPRMKSIVMINSSPLPSSSSCSSPASPIAGLHQRNPTPCAGEEQPAGQQRSLFKTRVNIGGAGATQVVVLANNKKPQLSGPVEWKQHQDLTGEEDKQQEQSRLQPAFERRRSLRNSSSMRRRLVLATGQQQLPAQARPGSPLPRSCLQHQEQVELAEDLAESGGGKLQRALVLAQKYNYSPTKLAASKLGAKLSLSPNSSSNHNHNHKPNSRTQTETPEPQEAQADSAQSTGGLRQPTLSPRLGKPPNQGDQTRRHSAGEGQIRISGRMELDISYFAKTGSLTVHVLQCSRLAAVSKRRTTSNPYVKLYLLPDRSKSGKRKSSIRRSQLEPKFDEKFTFGPVQLGEFSQKILWLSVWHKDRLGRNEFLGEILLPLAQVRQQLVTSDLCQSTGAKWYPLQERTMVQQQQQQKESSLEKKKKKQQQLEHKLGELQLKAARLAAVAPTAGHHHQALQQTTQPEPLEGMRVCLGPIHSTPGSNSQTPPNATTTITGQLFVALKFVVGQNGQFKTGSSRTLRQAEGELHVMIKEAHNIGGFVDKLPPPAGALPNPFCKCYLLNSEGRRLAKQKTPHLKRTVNPRWDYRCTFAQLRLAALASQAIEIQMFNRDSILVSNEHLGGVRLCKAHAQGSQQTSSSSTNTNTNDDATSIASSERSSSVDGSLRPGLGSFKRQDSSSVSNGGGIDELDGALCNERESRLWTQMLARPNIWVYGELKLRQLPPLIPLGESIATTTSTTTTTAVSTGSLQQQ